MAILRGEEARQYMAQNPEGSYKVIQGGASAGGVAGGPDPMMKKIYGLLSSGIDNPDMNNRLMDIIMQKVLEPDPEEQMRTALANRILESDDPDLNAYRKLMTPGTNIDDIFTAGGEKTEVQTRKDKEIEKLRKKNDLKQANLLEKLSDDDYQKYKSGGYRLFSE